MNRAMTKEMMLTNINYMVRDMVMSNAVPFARNDEKTWELRIEDLRRKFDLFEEQPFITEKRRCNIKSFVINVKTANGYALLTVKKVKYTVITPACFGYVELEFQKDIEDFDDIQLMCFQLNLTQAAFYALGDFPDWYYLGYDSEDEYNEAHKNDGEDEQ